MADPDSDWDGNGSYSYRDDEFVEIFNPGPGPLPLDGLFLADELGGYVFGFTGTLAEGAVRVVYGSESVAWEQANGQAATGLRLGNDGDTVQLVQVIEGVSTTVDAYTYTTYEAEDDRASGRNPDGGTWELFDALNPYAGETPPAGNGLPPSPGGPNGMEDPPPSPVAERSWGQIKALYTVR